MVPMMLSLPRPGVWSLGYLNREGKIHQIRKHLRQGFNTPKQGKWLIGLSKEKVLIKWKYFKARAGLHCMTWMQVNIFLLLLPRRSQVTCGKAVNEVTNCFEHEFSYYLIKHLCE